MNSTRRSWFIALLLVGTSLCIGAPSLAQEAAAATYGITTPGTSVYPNGGMVRAGFLQLPSGWNQAFATAVDSSGVYAYLASDTNPAFIYKINVASMQPVARLQLAPGEINLRCIMIDANDDFAYVGTFTTPPIVVKIDLRNFERVGAIAINAADAGIQSGAYSESQNSCFFATWRSPIQVYRVDLATFTSTSPITTTGSAFANEARLRPFSNQIFLSCNLTSGQIARVNLNPFGALSPISALTSENSLRSLDFDSSGTMVFATTSADPAKVLKYDAETRARIGAATLNAGEAEGYLTLVNRSNSHVYVGTSTAPARLVQVNAATMTREAAIPMSPANHLRSGALVDGRYTILASGYGFPSSVTKVSTTPRRSMRATKVTIPERTYLKRMGMYQHTAAPMRLAIYHDTTPFVLAWQSDLVESDGMEEFVIAESQDGGTLLQAGDYWLAWQCDTDLPAASYVAGTANTGWAASISNFGVFPETIYPEMATKNDQNWSIFLETGNLSDAVDWTAYE